MKKLLPSLHINVLARLDCCRYPLPQHPRRSQIFHLIHLTFKCIRITIIGRAAYIGPALVAVSVQHNIMQKLPSTAFIPQAPSANGRSSITTRCVFPPPSSSDLSMSSNTFDAYNDHAPTAVQLLNNQMMIASSTSSSTTTTDVLSTEDIVVGTILAFILAFGWSFLNGQSSSSTFISWPNQRRNRGDVVSSSAEVKETSDVGGSTTNDVLSVEGDNDNNVVFNEDNWKEISKEENYVLYNTKIRQKNTENSERKPMQNISKIENKLVLIALLVLFVPIFSVEFFFALSRQFICEMGVGGGELVDTFCSPIVGR